MGGYNNYPAKWQAAPESQPLEHELGRRRKYDYMVKGLKIYRGGDGLLVRLFVDRKAVDEFLDHARSFYRRKIGRLCVVVDDVEQEEESSDDSPPAGSVLYWSLFNSK